MEGGSIKETDVKSDRHHRNVVERQSGNMNVRNVVMKGNQDFGLNGKLESEQPHGGSEGKDEAEKEERVNEGGKEEKGLQEYSALAERSGMKESEHHTAGRAHISQEDAHSCDGGVGIYREDDKKEGKHITPSDVKKRMNGKTNQMRALKAGGEMLVMEREDISIEKWKLD